MKRVLIRADGSSQIGLGHLTRQIDIANELRNLNYFVIFLTKDYPEAIAILKRNKLKIITLSTQQHNFKGNMEQIEKILTDFNIIFDLIIIDLFQDFENQSYLNTFKKFCNKLFVVSDDPNKVTIEANGVFLISPNQTFINYDITKSHYYRGLQFFPLHRRFQKVPKKKIKKKVTYMLLTFGGSDPQNYSGRILKVLANMHLNITILLILGAAYSEDSYKELLLYKAHNISIKRNQKNMIKHYFKADICICSAGNTVIELLTCGVPCLVLPQTETEDKRAEALEKQKLIIKLDLNFEDNQFLSNVKKLIESYSLRLSLSKSAQNYVDGQGILRIIKILTFNEK